MSISVCCKYSFRSDIYAKFFIPYILFSVSFDSKPASFSLQQFRLLFVAAIHFQCCSHLRALFLSQFRLPLNLSFRILLFYSPFTFFFFLFTLFFSFFLHSKIVYLLLDFSLVHCIILKADRIVVSVDEFDALDAPFAN